MNLLNILPTEGGAYALHLQLPQLICLKIGCLGEFPFPPREYLYLGSAKGPGGLGARLRRHIRGPRSLYWHVDFLRAAAQVAGFWYTFQPSGPSPRLPLECTWSQTLTSLPEAHIPTPGFGASDCRAGCSAHLITFPAGTSLVSVRWVLSQSIGITSDAIRSIQIQKST